MVAHRRSREASQYARAAAAVAARDADGAASAIETLVTAQARAVLG
jgi:hypothetical protein